MCVQMQQHYQFQQQIFHKIYLYLLDIAHARMVKLDEQSRKPPLHTPEGLSSTDTTDVFLKQITKLKE